MAKSKNEIDKEIMYRKIMPTSGRFSQSQEPVIPQNQTPAAVSMTAAPTRPKPSASPVNHTSAVNAQFQESRDMILVNIMEDLVLSRLDSTLARFNCCKCNKCKKDIAALALNRLEPRYFVMKEHDEKKRAEAEEEYASAVTSALIQAILIVKKSPRH